MAVASPLVRLRLGALPALLATALSACDSPSGPAPVPVAQRTTGVTLADWTEAGYRSPACLDALDAIAATGARDLAIVVTAYSTDARSSDVLPRAGRTPSREAVTAAADAAIARGLRVTVKPHVDPLDGSWRASIRPDDPDAWFAAYSAFILEWAAFADSVGAPEFCVGTELAGTIHRDAHWRALIREVRAVFRGRIVYAASWDEAFGVPFWDATDRIGVNAYFALSSRRDPTRVDLLVGWELWLERLRSLARLHDRPVLFTEIGYRSVDGAAMDPSNFAMDRAVDAAEQADLYWAALTATRDEDWFAGLFWWNWLADGRGGPANDDYTPSGKPAADVLAEFWGGTP